LHSRVPNQGHRGALPSGRQALYILPNHRVKRQHTFGIQAHDRQPRIRLR
jgi:hypothetical protein